MNIRIFILVLLAHLTFLPMSAQSEFYLNAFDSDGNKVDDIVLQISQKGKKIPISSGNLSTFQLNLDPTVALEICLDDPRYLPLKSVLSPPIQTSFLEIYLGREGEMEFHVHGQKRYFSYRPGLVATIPNSGTLHQSESKKQLLALVEKHGMTFVESPFPSPSIPDELSIQPITFYFQHPPSSPSFFFDDQFLLALRESGLVEAAGIPLWPGSILLNSLETSNEKPPQGWMDAHQLTLSPSSTEREYLLLSAPKSVGLGILQILREAEEMNLFNQLSPKTYP